MSQYTPGPEFTAHLLALRQAIDKVQPIADYRGNFGACLAIVNLEKAMAPVIADIIPFSGDDSLRKIWKLIATTPRILAFLRHLETQWTMQAGAKASLDFDRTTLRALLAEIDGAGKEIPR